MNEDPIHVLLVEDDPDQSELIQRVLKRQQPPVDVSAVSRGSECLDMAPQKDFSAVLLDYSLPGMNGLTVLKKLREQGCKIPVIMVTGQGDERVAVEAMREGASDYLIKTTGYLTTLPTILGKVLKQYELATENVRLYEETHQRAKEQSALNALARAVSQSLETEELLRLALETVLAMTGREVGYVRLMDKDSSLLHLVACRGLSDSFIEPYRTDRPPGKKTQAMLATGAPLIVNNIQQADIRPGTRAEKLAAMAWIPLTGKGKVLGILNLATREHRPFSTREVEFLAAVGSVIGVALENSRLFEQTKRQALELEKANRVKSEFLSIMSHELRTPMHAIIGYAGMIQDRVLGEINEEQERALGKMLKQSQDLLVMITSILQATRIEADAVKVTSDHVSLVDFLDKLRAAYDVPLNRELTLRWDYPSNLPEVKTDIDKLRHILQNLINNAVKFTEKGYVKVSARAIEDSTAPLPASPHAPLPHFVEFKVADTGIGIPREALPHIFDMFRQVDSSDTRTYGGVGLGLYIVKTYTRMLGGKVEVESEPGKGTTFTVALPAPP